MPSEYFYTPPSRISANGLLIDGEELQHLTHVMRRREGDAIVVVDGRGSIYDVVIRRIGRSGAECEIRSKRTSERESGIAVTIAVGVLKNPAKFDFLVEKVTELGVRTIVPLQTSRTIAQHAREERWQKLALAAMKQSERSVLPLVQPLTTLAEYLHGQEASSLKLLPHEQVSTPTLRDAVPHTPFSSAAICVGPEGGFTDEEVEQATARGFIPVSLGPRRLRTETAAIVAAAGLLLPL